LFSGLRTPSGNPGRLLTLAVLGRFQAVISSQIIDEIVRNVRNKAPQLQRSLRLLFDAVEFEVLPSPTEATVQEWIDAGYGSDAPIVAATFSSEIDLFCTGDVRFRRRLVGREVPFRVITPAELVALLES
jgi:predicted nucleic acid-binding protein